MAKRRKLIRWTRDDVKLIRQHAGRKPVAQIAKALKRSVAAVRYKAHILKVSLAAR